MFVYAVRIVGGYRVRYRKCRECGRRVVTREVIIRRSEAEG